MKRYALSFALLSIVLQGFTCHDNGDMSTERLVALAAESADVEDLLYRLPRHMRMNYTMMERSGGLQPASLEHPRLIHFGSDARFILAVSTDPRDPAREVIEFAELDTEDGGWNFRTLDLRTEPATLDQPAVCTSCHGQTATRPIWGTYPSWPGAFSPADRAIPPAHARRLNRLRNEPRDRFGHLVHFERLHRPGNDLFSLPGRNYPYANIVLNFEIAAAAGEGFFLEMKKHPLYPELREGFFLLRYGCEGRRSSAHAHLQQVLARQGAAGRPSRATLYELLGVPASARALSQPVFNARPRNEDRTWSSGESSIESFIEFLILDDLIQDRPELGSALARVPDAGYYAIPGVSNLEEDRRLRLLHNYGITGEARQNVRASSGLNLGRMEQGLLDPASRTICNFLTSDR